MRTTVRTDVQCMQAALAMARSQRGWAKDDAIGWARYYAGQIIGGVCLHCEMKNGSHLPECRENTFSRGRR